MKTLRSWILGILIVISYWIVIVVVRFLSYTSGYVDGQLEDTDYSLVAVSWGARMNETKPLFYQVQVSANDPDNDGIFEVSAKVCIGTSAYFQDLGILGTANGMEEAVRKYGQIVWYPDRLTIGGNKGVKATLLRKKLERHR